MRSITVAIACAVLSASGVTAQFWVEPPTTADPNTVEDCTYWHVAAAGDSCQSVSSANFITPAQLESYNPSLAGGSCTFITGNSYCVEQNWGIPPETPTSTASTAGPTSTGNGITTPSPIQTGMTGSCNKFHFVVSGNGCQSIQDTYGISFAQLFAWNPAIGSNCQSLWLDTYVCVGVIGSTASATTTQPPSTTAPGNGITTPTPTQEGMVGNCNKFHFVVSGDGCRTIQSMYGVSFAQLFAWNPAIGSNCQSMWLETYVCVGVLGGGGGPSLTPSSSPTTTSTGGNGITTPTPTQAGMVGNCNRFHFVSSGDGCDTIANRYGVTFGQLLSWNPAIGSNCQSMWLDTYLCVGIIGGGTLTTTTRPPTPTSGNGIATPTPTQPGMVNNCRSFYKVVGGDNCEIIANRFGISLANFMRWNTGVGSNCQSMWLDAYVCVAVL